MAPNQTWSKFCPETGVEHGKFYGIYKHCGACGQKNPTAPTGTTVRSTTVPPDRDQAGLSQSTSGSRPQDYSDRDVATEPPSSASTLSHHSFVTRSMEPHANNARQAGMRPRITASTAPNANNNSRMSNFQRGRQPQKPTKKEHDPRLRVFTTLYTVDLRVEVKKQRRAGRKSKEVDTHFIWHWSEVHSPLTGWNFTFYQSMWDDFIYDPSVEHRGQSDEQTLIKFLLQAAPHRDIKDPTQVQRYHDHYTCTGFSSDDEPIKASIDNDKHDHKVEDMLLQFPVTGNNANRTTQVNIVIVLAVGEIPDGEITHLPLKGNKEDGKQSSHRAMSQSNALPSREKSDPLKTPTLQVKQEKPTWTKRTIDAENVPTFINLDTPTPSPSKNKTRVSPWRTVDPKQIPTPSEPSNRESSLLSERLSSPLFVDQQQGSDDREGQDEGSRPYDAKDMSSHNRPHNREDTSSHDGPPDREDTSSHNRLYDVEGTSSHNAQHKRQHSLGQDQQGPGRVLRPKKR